MGTLYDSNVVYLSKGTIQWRHKSQVHHNIQIDHRTNEIVAVCYDKEISKDLITRHDCIRIFDRNGHVLFYWSARHHIEEIQKIVLPQKLPYKIAPHPRTKAMHRHYTHFNYAQPLPPNNLEEKFPAFRRGNILISDWGNNFLFIIGRTSNKIEWALNLGARGYDAPHSAHILDDGRILIYVNAFKNSATLRSGMSIYSVDNDTFEDFDVFSAADYSWKAGSAYLLPNKEDYIISFFTTDKVVLFNNRRRSLEVLIDNSVRPKDFHRDKIHAVRWTRAAAIDQFLKFSAL